VHELADLGLERCLQQCLGAEHVGDHEVRGAEDGPVHVRFGGEVHDHVDAGHDLDHLVTVADVALDERQPRVVANRCEVGLAAGVGELVEHHDLGVGQRRVGATDGLADVMGTDETGTAGNQYAHLDPTTPFLDGKVNPRGPLLRPNR
jgi:hypothetical protein